MPTAMEAPTGGGEHDHQASLSQLLEGVARTADDLLPALEGSQEASQITALPMVLDRIDAARSLAVHYLAVTTSTSSTALHRIHQPLPRSDWPIWCSSLVDHRDDPDGDQRYQRSAHQLAARNRHLKDALVSADGCPGCQPELTTVGGRGLAGGGRPWPVARAQRCRPDLHRPVDEFLA